jgi:predicted glycosyltransferase
VTDRPRLLFYCQHSLGLGHLVRSRALVEELARDFDVVFVSGGKLPREFAQPAGVELVPLLPLAADVDGKLVSPTEADVTETLVARRDVMLARLRADRPSVIVVELFPFGRKKFAGELVPLLEGARASTASPLVVCSLRDILVDRGSKQPAHDAWAAALVNHYFDLVLVHADESFARLEESFRPEIPLPVPVRYTGFVVPDASSPPRRLEDGRWRVLVSAGGGLVGERLLATALAARKRLPSDTDLKLVAGPFMPEPGWRRLQDMTQSIDGVELVRSVAALEDELAAASASLSQCGYNTALAVVRSGKPALVVPFEEGQENEQARRASRLQELGAVRVLSPGLLDEATLAAELVRLRKFRPSPTTLKMDGARRTTEILGEELAARRAGAVGRAR